MFISSGLARQFERGNPKVIAGMSGIEIAVDVIFRVTGRTPNSQPTYTGYRAEEYWCGWALAHYQWYSSRSFSTILRLMPFDYLMDMYLTLHEADITKLYIIADDIYTRTQPQTNLRRFRELAGLSQSELSAEAGVSLRSIQMYEQRNKHINRAQAVAVLKIARVLGCDVADLIEAEQYTPRQIT
jgi:DNA-binding XRE family transcriptional regulator